MAYPTVNYQPRGAVAGLQPITETNTAQMHPLGMIASASDVTYGEGLFIYLKGQASTAAGDLVCYDTKLGTTVRTIANAATTRGPMAIAMSANVADQYGWYQVVGSGPIKAGTVSAGNDVYLTSTVGQVDSAVVGEALLNNIAFTGATSAGFATVQFNYPTLSGADTGANSGDVTLGAIGASANANGATLTAQVLNLEPASTSFGGIVTTGTQSFAGAKTFDGAVALNGGVTLGNASGDTLVVTSATASLVKEINHDVTVAASTTVDTVGATLTVASGAGAATNAAGGALTVISGTGAGTGASGEVTIKSGAGGATGNSADVILDTGVAAGGTVGSSIIKTGGTSRIAVGPTGTIALKNTGTNLITSDTTAANASSTVGAFTLKPTATLDANDLVLDVQSAAAAHLLKLDLEGDCTVAGEIAAVGATITGAASFSSTVALNGVTSLVDAKPNSVISGAGITNTYNGRAVAGEVKITIAKEAWTAAAVTQDITLCTIPAKMRIKSVYADTTEAYAGLAGTIELKIGSSVGGGEILAAHDVKTIAVTKGLADVDMGTAMVAAAMIQGAYLPSFTGTTNISIRLTSGAGDIGVGGVTNLTFGSTTYYLLLEAL